jgi:lysophospholipase L1-like esterase
MVHKVIRLVIMARIHILGNSNAYGYGVEDRSWPALIKADTNRRRHNGDQPRVTTVSLASPGNLLTHIIEAGLLEASIACNRRGKQIALFCIGACDASILRSRGETSPRRAKADFGRDLDRLASIGEKLNADQPSESALRLLLLSAVPVDEGKSSSSQEGDDFDGPTIREYDAVMKERARNNGIGYIDVNTNFDTTTMLANDGIHLSEAGDAFIYENTMPTLLSELGIRAPRT